MCLFYTDILQRQLLLQCTPLEEECKLRAAVVKVIDEF